MAPRTVRLRCVGSGDRIAREGVLATRYLSQMIGPDAGARSASFTNVVDGQAFNQRPDIQAVGEAVHEHSFATDVDGSVAVLLRAPRPDLAVADRDHFCPEALLDRGSRVNARRHVLSVSTKGAQGQSG